MEKPLYLTFVVMAGLLIAATPSRAKKPIMLSLEDAQAAATEGNQMLKAVRAGVQRARSLKLETWSGHLPSLRFSEGAVRSNDAVNAFGFRLKQERFTQADFAVNRLNDPAAITNFQTRLEVQQPIFNGGQAVYSRLQASEAVLSAEAELTRREDEVRFRTAEAYWSVSLAQEALGAVQQGLETALAHQSAAESRYREETAPLSDVLAARVRLAQLKGEQIAARNRVEDAADGLSLVMGLEMEAGISPSDRLQHRAANLDMQDLISRALNARPDLAAIRHRAKAAHKGIGVARAAFLPHFNAFLDMSLDSDRMFGRKGESWTAGAVLTWDLFSGLRSIGAVQAAKAEAVVAEAEQAFHESEVVREVRQGYRQVIASDAQVDVAEEGLKQAEERLRIAQLQYREGLETAADLLDAEAELTQARVRRLDALYALNVGLARLRFAVGEQIE